MNKDLFFMVFGFPLGPLPLLGAKIQKKRRTPNVVLRNVICHLSTVTISLPFCGYTLGRASGSCR